MGCVVMEKGKNLSESCDNRSKEAKDASKENGGNVCTGKMGFVCLSAVY